jgi:predicted phosphoribosyltransferase/dienelactone hydrolase
MATNEPETGLAVEIPANGQALRGILSVPAGATGVVAFAHGSGSGRHSPRNQFVARVLQEAGLATLLLDLLGEEEEADRMKVFDVELLAERLLFVADWLKEEPRTAALPLGYFGASTGAGAALVAAARGPTGVGAVVSRGGRPDLAGDYLADVRAPTRLIVGGADEAVIGLNERALRRLRCPKDLVIISGATHLFPEPGALDEVARLARDWFLGHLRPPQNSPAGRDVAPEEEEVLMFRDREDAAGRLAAKLKGRKLHDPLVLGIPRGGVVIGAVLARELGADLDVILSRKLRAPEQPELALGAVAEDGRIYLEPRARPLFEELKGYLVAERRHQLGEIARRKKLFRAVRPAAAVAGRSVIVTDDGIATGATMIAALQTVKAQGAREVIVAVPVASPDRLREVGRCCDDTVCLLCPRHFRAIGEFYEDFSQVADGEVVELLRRFAPAAGAK